MFGKYCRSASHVEATQGFLSFAIFVFAFALATPVLAVAAPGQSRLQDEPVQEQQIPGASLARHGGRLLIVGGRTDDGFSGRVVAFDPGTQKTEVLTDELTPRADAAVLVFRGELFVIGGEGQTGAVTTVERLDLVTGAIARGPDLPGPRAGAKATEHQGLIVVGGGHHGWGPVMITHVLEPESFEWYRAPRIDGDLVAWQSTDKALYAFVKDDLGRTLRRRLSVKQRAFVDGGAIVSGCEQALVPVKGSLFCVSDAGVARALSGSLAPLGGYGEVALGGVGSAIHFGAGIAYVDAAGTVHWLKKRRR